MFSVSRLEFLPNTEKLSWMEYLIWQQPHQQILGNIETDLTSKDPDLFSQGGGSLIKIWF